MKFKVNQLSILFFNASESLAWVWIEEKESKEISTKFKLSQKDKIFLVNNLSSQDYWKLSKYLNNLPDERKQNLQEKWLTNIIKKTGIKNLNYKNIKKV